MLTDANPLYLVVCTRDSFNIFAVTVVFVWLTTSFVWFIICTNIMWTFYLLFKKRYTNGSYPFYIRIDILVLLPCIQFSIEPEYNIRLIEISINEILTKFHHSYLLTLFLISDEFNAIPKAHRHRCTKFAAWCWYQSHHNCVHKHLKRSFLAVQLVENVQLVRL